MASRVSGLRPPAQLGAALADVLTPALVVVMPTLEANEAAMRDLVRGNKQVALRPHAKLHKSAAFAKWHMETASRASEPVRGFCAQTVSEAAACLRAGSHDVLLTNAPPRHGALRLAELAAAFPAAQVSALVDCPEHVASLEAAAHEHGTTMGAYVEIECGQDRCGCAPASPEALALAQTLVASEVLNFGGLHVYNGAIQHVRGTADRHARVTAGPADAARRTVALLAEAGVAVPSVTGGGTGTLLQDLAAGTHDELQPGSYLFMDGKLRCP